MASDGVTVCSPRIGTERRSAIPTAEVQKAVRTIVIFYAHGYPRLVRNGLAHAGYAAGARVDEYPV